MFGQTLLSVAETTLSRFPFGLFEFIAGSFELRQQIFIAKGEGFPLGTGFRNPFFKVHLPLKETPHFFPKTTEHISLNSLRSNGGTLGQDRFYLVGNLVHLFVGQFREHGERENLFLSFASHREIIVGVTQVFEGALLVQ